MALFADIPQLAWWLGGVLALLVLYLLYVFRYAVLVRMPVWLVSHVFYRIKAYGVENIPLTGPVLLVSNHVSHIDAGLILSAQKRKIRFLIWAPFLNVPVLGSLLRMAKVIPIKGTGGPRAIINSLRTASEALAKGEIVCIFAEGGITRTGFLLPFQRGLEQITKRTPAAIVPVCLDHVWGSVFSFQRGRFFWKLPKQFPYKVFVTFGKPLPPGTPAHEVRQAIQLLSAESAIRRAKYRKPVHRMFVRMACRHPFRPCLVDPNNKAKPVMSYGETLAAAKILTKLLRPMLAEEKMVGLWIPPSAGGAIANIVVAFLGKTAVNLNYSITSEIIQASIRQCGIRKVLTSKLFTAKVPLDPGPGVELIYLDDFRKQITTRQRLLAFLSVLLVPRIIQDRWILGLARQSTDNLATVIFSSGSTGEPKGVMLSHSNIAANVESVIQAIDPLPKDRLVGILPFFHSFGYTVTLWVPLQVGASTAFYPNPLQAKEVGDLIRTYKCTILLITPTFLRSYLKRCQAEDLASLRLIIGGAEKLPRALAEDFKQKFGVMPLEGYGCTELSPVAAANVPNFENEETRQVGNKSGSVGQCLPGVAARIVNPETFELLPPDTEGMLLMYGANVMKGYLGREDLTRVKISAGGWYITGDLAMIDEDGFITITGRQERFAKVGGEMVPLEKVEEEIHAVLGTSERLCAVTALPDSKRGERLVVLYTTLSMPVDEVVAKLGTRGLPNIYLPGPRDFFEVKEMPVLGSGKLDLKRCKQMALEAVNGAA